MRLALLLLVALVSRASSQVMVLLAEGADANGAISAQPPAMAYDALGNWWMKTGAGLNSTGWVKLLSGSTNPPAPPSNLGVFNPADMISLRNRTHLDMDRMLFGKTDTNTQWQWFDGTGVNTNCWVWPMNFSGISMIEASGQTITLVTRRHGITCGHSTPEIGSETIFVGHDLVRYTNWVQLVTNCPIASAPFTSDLTVIQFSNDFPSVVRPFPILPTNYAAYGDLHRLAGPIIAEALWYRPNTMRMNVKMVSNWVLGSGYPSVRTESSITNWNAPVFTEADVTGGDSGGPVFLIVNGQPAFLFATWYNDPMGPLVSYPGRPEWIQSVCGTNYPLSFVSMSRYPKVP